MLVTGPYMHDGSQADAVGRHGPLQQGRRAEPVPRRRHRSGSALTESEIDDLVAFLAALTSDRYQAIGKKELARQRALSRTKRPERDIAAAIGARRKGRVSTGPFGDPMPPQTLKRPCARSEDARWRRRHKSIETKYLRGARRALRALEALDRRSFLKVAAASAGAALAKGLLPPHSFQLVNVAYAAPAAAGLVAFAYISDTHLYDKKLNERFVRAALKAVDDVNALDPQPDFVLFGGDLAQLGKPEELELGAQILKNVKAPVKMMVGEHDWFLDMGERVAGALRRADLLVRPQGRALRRAR